MVAARLIAIARTVLCLPVQGTGGQRRCMVIRRFDDVWQWSPGSRAR